jgi:uncharacterized protein (UPF0335 family)
MTDDKVKSIVEKIERLEEKQQALLTEKRRIYTEAKKAKPDLNTKALRKIIAERRMKDREQVEAAMHNYRVALGMAVNDVANGASLRDAEAKHGIPKSTIQRHRTVPREEKNGNGTARGGRQSWKFRSSYDADLISPPPEKDTPARCRRARAQGRSAPSRGDEPWQI